MARSSPLRDVIHSRRMARKTSVAWGIRAASRDACRVQGHLRAKYRGRVHGSDGEETEKPSGSRIPRSAAAAFGALAGVRLGPGGAIAGAAAGPYLQDLASKAWDEFRTDSQRRQADMLRSAAEAAEAGPEELAGLIGKSEQTRLLTATAMAGASRTAWPPQVAALGRALADGLIAADTAQPNIADLVLPAMAEMERLHVSLLELLVRWVPETVAGRPVRTQVYRDSRTHAGDEWRADQRIWSARLIGEVRPPLLPVLTGLIGTLQRHGLAVQHDDTASVLANYSKQFDLAATGMSAALSEAVLKHNITPPPSWSPTELGERVLGYYRLAAAEFDAAQALAPGED